MATTDTSKNSIHSPSHPSQSPLRDATSERISEASPRVRETIDQFSGVANDVLTRTQTWLSQGNNKNYGMIALVATVGVLGFVLGRSLGSHRSSEA